MSYKNLKTNVFLFSEHIKKLLDNGSAYMCFCTERRLNILRKDALRNRQIPKYDNKCRSLSKEEISDKLKVATPYCIRFKVCVFTLHYDS